MKHFSFYFVLLCLLTSCVDYPQVSSPDGKLKIRFSTTDDGGIGYSVSHNNKQIINFSPLGFETEEYSLKDGFEIQATHLDSCTYTWETVWGEERYITDNHNSLIVYLHHKSGIYINIEFRVFNDGYGLRYIFPKQSQQSLTITDELTAYNFAKNHAAWSIPWRTEYYEGLWTRQLLQDETDTLCSPITLEMSDGSYGFLHEAALNNYPAQNLYMQDGLLHVYLTPWRDRTTADGREIKAYIDLPFSSPWRMLILTNTLSELTASRIMLNLNEPCKIKDPSWIKPTKFIGIWWGMHIKTMTWEMGPNHGATTANMERYLRFAKDHGIGAVLAEGWNTGWEDWKHFSFTQPYPDWDMDYLSHLADSLGVQIVGHNETGGNAADYETGLDETYQYHASHDIHTIKTGYVAPIIRTLDGLQWNKGQSGVRHYRKVIETAARYHIAIDNHEPVMPTGLQRTYPNLMTQEGVRGQEWNAWSNDGGNPCEHVTVLPYTRILAGPVDYTPGVFHFENPVIPTTRVHSTLANQLGLFVCFYSPVQMACDLPEYYMGHPDAFSFIEEVPCDWERSVLIDGKIGDYCIYARQGRGTEDWYIGGITDEEAREIKMSFSMLEPNKTYKLKLWRDGDDAEWENNPYSYSIEEREITADDTITIRMASGGGFAGIIKAVD